MFVSYFFKIFLRIIFENTENTIFVLFENFSCFLNLIFSVFFVLIKKIGNQICSPYFPYS